MKKIVTILLITFLLSTSLVFASNFINGEFKGYGIVNVEVNSQELDNLDVPAINFNGRTVLPVRAVAESMGSIVEWDAETWTANLVKPDAFISTFRDVAVNEEDFTIDFLDRLTVFVENENWSFIAGGGIAGIPNGKYEYSVRLIDPNGRMIAKTPNAEIEITDFPLGYTIYEPISSNLTEVGIWKLELLLYTQKDGKYSETPLVIDSTNLYVVSDEENTVAIK